MRWVRLDDWEVEVPFAKQPESEYSDVASIQNEVPADLPRYRKVEMANFRIAQIV